MKFNIYCLNHGKLDGIEDFLAILKSIITRQGYDVDITEKLDKNAINLVIDEFTNVICNNEIIEFKNKYPEARLYYILTEFIEEKFLVRSFNFFGNFVDAALLAAMNIYFRVSREDFDSPSLKDWLVGLLYLPLMIIYYTGFRVRNLISAKKVQLRKKLHTSAYMKMRYLGLEKMLKYADGVILSHGMIKKGLLKLNPDVPILGIICPEIKESDYLFLKNNLFDNKILSIEVTGSITPYRRKYIELVNKDILLFGLKNLFDTCKIIAFSSFIVGKRSAYSLHPPQSRSWKYSSPTRIYRALVHDKNIPVLTRMFNQHPIEKLCLVYEGQKSLIEMYQFYKKPSSFIEHLEPRLLEYMEYSKRENNHIVNKLINDVETN